MGREESLVESGRDFEVTAPEIVIVDEGSYEYAALHLKDIRKLEKEIKEFFKPIKQKQDEAKKAILQREKESLDPVLKARKLIESKIKDYIKLVKSKRREEAAKAKEQAREDARKSGMDPMLVPVEEPITEVPKVEGVSTATNWRFRIVDVSKIHADFMVPDEKKIGKTVRAMHMDAQSLIGGIEVYPDETVKTRL